ncbi:arginase family protein (plasmid) [Agrobacterium vitis]
MSLHYASIFASGMRPLTVLTRCAVALTTLPVVARNRPDACIVWLDAHAHLNTPETSTSGYLGGMAISGAAGPWDSGLGGQLALSNVILVGARDIDPAERDLIDAVGLQVVSPHGDIVAKMVDAIASRPVYVHLDCDVLDAGIMPSDYEIEGGLTLTELRRVAEALATCEIVGVEVTEFQSAWEKDGKPVSPAKRLDSLGLFIAYFGSYRRLKLLTGITISNILTVMNIGSANIIRRRRCMTVQRGALILRWREFTEG